jgi:hypothetical protein
MPLTRITSQLISIPSNYPLTGSLNGTASYATTASFAMNGGSGGGGGSTSLTGITFPYVSGSNTYTLSQSAVAANDLLLSVNGVVQTPTTDYTVSASSVTFTDSYPSGSSVNVRYLVTATSSSFVDLANIVLTGTTTGDAYYPQVAALLHFDGTNGSTTITDNSKNNLAVTSVNGAAISTAQSKFGGASVLFDGTNDYVSIPDNEDLEPSTNNLTWEMWIKTTSSVQYATLYCRSPSSFGSGMWSLMINHASSTTGDIALYVANYSTGAPLLLTTGVSIRDDVWHHIAIVRNGSAWICYVDGTSRATGTYSGGIGNISAVTIIGADGFYGRYYSGYIDEFRITNGYARYTGAFTPPTAAFSNTGGDVGKALVVNSTATGVSIGTAGFNLNSSNINRIINGAMTIDQRNAGAAQTITASAALAYTADRWYAYCTGANVTGQRITGSANNQYAYRFTGAASVTAIGFGQRIEAANSIDLAGSTATLGVDLANSLLTSVTWTAYYATTSDTFGTLASPTRTQISTGTFTVTSTLSRYSAQIFIPSAATTGIEIVFSVGAQTSGTWTIDNVQLEAGPLATPFERRMIGTELVNCQRYCYSLTTAVGTNYFLAPGSFGGTTFGFIGFNLPQIMRTIPILSSAVTAGNYQVYIPNGGTYQTLTSLALNAVSTNNFILFQFGIAGGGTAGQVCYLNAPSTTIPVILTSEL